MWSDAEWVQRCHTPVLIIAVAQIIRYFHISDEHRHIKKFRHMLQKYQVFFFFFFVVSPFSAMHRCTVHVLSFSFSYSMFVPGCCFFLPIPFFHSITTQYLSAEKFECMRKFDLKIRNYFWNVSDLYHMELCALGGRHSG